MCTLYYTVWKYKCGSDWIFQISPSDIESVILQHEAVAQVCVVGVDDPNGGDKIPRAWVVLNKEKAANHTLDDIKNFANG